MVSSRVHAWSVQRVRDVPHADRIEVVVRKPRLVCAEPACNGGRSPRSLRSCQPGPRCTTRVKTAVPDAVIDSGRAVSEVAGAFGVAWWTVQATVNAAAVLLPSVDDRHIRRLGRMSTATARSAGTAILIWPVAAGGAVDVDDRERPTAARCWGLSSDCAAVSG